MGFPPTVFELPGGSCSDWPPITPSDVLACYLTNLAFGMKGHNYYVFTGGPNPPGAGAITDMYDYGAGIGPTGDIRPLYDAQRAFGQIVAAHPWLTKATRLTDFRLALDFEYARTNHYWTAGGDLWPSPKQAWELLHTGPLTTALCAGLSPEMVNLAAPLTSGLPLIVVSAAGMAAAHQQHIVDLLEAGGKAVILPVLPWLDDDLRPCAILAEYLRAPQTSPVRESFRRPTIAGIVNVRGEVTALWNQLPPEAEILGVEEHSGRPIAWKIETSGGGEVIVLSFAWLHSMRSQEQMLSAVLARLGCRPVVTCSNPNVWITAWTTGTQTVLFLLNLFSAPMTADVSVQLPDGQRVSAGTHQLDSVTVKLVDVG